MQIAQMLAGYTLGASRYSAPRHGQEDPREDDQQQRERFVSGCVERGVDRAQADAIFDLLERFAEYGFNKSHAAAYALVAYQTAYMKANYPVEFLAAIDDLRHEQYRQARGIPRRSGTARDQGRAAVGQPFRHRLRGRGAYDLLRARGAQGCRQPGGRSDRRGAQWAIRSATSPISRPASIRAASTSACWKASPPPARSTRSSRSARAPSPPSTPSSRPRSAATRRAPWARTSCSAGGGADVRLSLPQAEPWLPADRLRREFDAIGFFLSGHPLDDYAAVLARAAGAVLGGVRPRGEGGRERGKASPARSSRARSGAPRPAAGWASSACPTPPAITKR